MSDPIPSPVSPAAPVPASTGLVEGYPQAAAEPSQSYPAQPAPSGQPAPGQPAPGQFAPLPYPPQPTSSLPVPQPYPVQPNPVQPYPGQPYPGRFVAQPSGQPPAQQQFAASPWASQVVGAGGNRPPATWTQRSAPAPPGPVKTRWIVLSVAAGLAVLGLVATLGIVAAVRQGSGPGVAASSKHKGDLRDLVVPAPTGSQPWKTAPEDEALDLTAASQVDGNNNADLYKELLTKWHFVRGYVRRWRTDKMVVQVVLYQFTDEPSATSYARDALTANASTPNRNPGSGYGYYINPSPVDGTDNGITLVLSIPFTTGDTGTLSMARVTDAVTTVTTIEAPPAAVAPADEIVVSEVKLL